ncbi:MAG: hypothetical protein JRJ87_16145 [Deltaproteobacteria bacterium]|nr:hypothetical protein [Deltaproteobacteria bacterium]
MNSLSSSLFSLALLAITTFTCSSPVSKHDLRHPRHTSLTRKDKVCQSDKRQPSKVRQQFLESVAAIKGRVVRIEIKGNPRVDSEAIIESIKTKAGDDLNASRIGKDVQNIWNLDLFDDIWVEVEEIPEGLVVKYNVLEKPVYAKVFYAGITQENVITIDALLDTRTRQLFRPGQLIKKMEQVTRYYRQAGFKRTKIDYRK